jgi:CRISPR-associated protein Cas1
MATLYLDRRNLELRLDGAALAVYQGGVRKGAVPLNLLERVIIRADTKLTSGVLGSLAAAGAVTVILSGRKGEKVAMVSGRLHSDASVRVAQYAKSLDGEWRSAWAGRFVAAKILRQCRLLRRWEQARPEHRSTVRAALQTLQQVRLKVRDRAVYAGELRGLEGAAQAAYLRVYTELFPSALQFNGRNRRPPRDPVNACLSLAYVLAHTEAVRCCWAAGLDPYVGFYHTLTFGRESLACDLLEPVRPRVDAWVWTMFRSRELRPEHFRTDQGRCLLGKAGRGRFYRGFEALSPKLSGSLRASSRLLVRSLRRETLPSFGWEDDEGDEIP